MPSLKIRKVENESETLIHPRVTDPVGTPPHWKNRPKICPRWSPVRKVPWNFIPIGKLHWTLIPTGKSIKNFGNPPLNFWAVNNRIRNPHPFKAMDFPSPLAFGSFILSPLAKKFPPGHWDRGVLIISVSRFHKTDEKYVQNFGKISNFPKVILVWPV